MFHQETVDLENSLLSSLLADEAFYPVEPTSLEETGLAAPFVEQLVLKLLGQQGTKHGRGVAELLCLPFRILENVLGSLRNQRLIVHAGSAPFNDYYYSLTDTGTRLVQSLSSNCSYVGPAPVRLPEYILSVEAQSISAETPQQGHLRSALEGITIDESLFEQLGPAINSGAGMFLYGAPGNGKSTLARRMTMCFGQEIWVPHAIIESGQIIKVLDPSYHEPVRQKSEGLLVARNHDTRWTKIRRPTVVVGGEMTMDTLEIRYDPVSHVSEAPLQLKSNCGCLVIDDFGRQRVAPEELLNRWIIPLENRHDFLTLATGQKIQVPFDQLIIFSTNLDPNRLVDEAFLRRIPYKVEVGDPKVDEFHQLFRLAAAGLGCEYRADAVDYLLERHYRPCGRPLRRCHPRDLLRQVRNYCVYTGRPIEMQPEYFDRVVTSYFTTVLTSSS
jgi:predicted ATPase with chaperone activity